MRTYLINLERDTQRLRSMTDQLAALSVPFERIEAVRGTAMPDSLKPYFLDANGEIASGLIPGEVGCYASHLKVMQMIAASGEPGLVLEDDLSIAPDFPSILDRMADLPEGWEIIRLSNSFRRHFFPVKALTGTYHAVKFARVPPSSAAYLITPGGARKFLSWKSLRSLPVDQDLRRTWDCGLVTYGIYPMPATPRTGGSSTINTAAPLPRRRRPRGSGVWDTIKRITHDIAWLGAVNWSLSLMPKSSRARELRSTSGDHILPA